MRENIWKIVAEVCLDMRKVIVNYIFDISKDYKLYFLILWPTWFWFQYFFKFVFTFTTMNSYVLKLFFLWVAQSYLYMNFFNLNLITLFNCLSFSQPKIGLSENVQLQIVQRYYRLWCFEKQNIFQWHNHISTSTSSTHLVTFYEYQLAISYI